MAEWVNALATEDLEKGQMKKLDIAGHSILIARAGDKFYAASNICPHMGGNLSQGSLNGTIVTCPRHGSQFDLKDGHVVRWTNWTGLTMVVGRLMKSPRPLPVYKTRVVDGQLQIWI